MSEATLEAFRQELQRLVTNYREGASRFVEERFDEASLRIDYLAPFFRALGWDMENVTNRPQSLRDVQVETRFYDDRRKRADYVFRTDGIDRFVCEAKGGGARFCLGGTLPQTYGVGKSYTFPAGKQPTVNLSEYQANIN